MKLLNKLLVALFTLALISSFAACGGKEVKDNSSSKPANSKPTSSNTENTESKEETSKEETKEDDKKEENNKDNNTSNNETTNTQKDYSKLIKGTWATKIDISEYLTTAEYEFDGEILIDFYVEFGDNNEYCEYIYEDATQKVLKNQLGDYYDEDFINDLTESLYNDFTNFGTYKFEENVLKVKYETAEDYIEIGYEFKSNSRLILSQTSDELEFKKK